MPTNGLIQPGAQTLTYAKYLQIDPLLQLQQPLADPPEHDEMLFIIIHQVYELWFKQLLHEVAACNRFLDRGVLMRVMAGLKRIDTIQKIMIHQVDVLETMPPDDFARFRERLSPASGFQSYQFRQFEFALGLKDPHYFKFYQASPDHTACLESSFRAPSLYDHFIQYLHLKRGYDIPADVLSRDVCLRYQAHEQIVDLFETIYRNPYEHSDIYIALEALMDLDEQLILWRYRHMAMVQRMIGGHGGTGGSGGAAYLQTTLSKRCFPEIWQVRQRLGTTYGKEKP
jgi:tryptophan 2,3-dioxygenase